MLGQRLDAEPAAGLAFAVDRDRSDRRLVFIAAGMAARVFGRGAGADKAAAAMFAERPDHGQARFEPAEIVRRMVVDPRCRLPCEMQQMRRPDPFDQPGRLRRVAQIGGVPADIAVADGRAGPVDRVNLARPAAQQGQAMPPDKARSSSDQNPRHAAKSGQVASRSDRIAGANGQSMAKAGSFQRTPEASSGTNTSPII